MFQEPAQILGQFGLKERTTVADLGAGSGAFALEAARRVGEFGVVYAIEVRKDMVPYVKNQARGQGLTNVEAIWGDIERRGGTRIADKSVDAVIIANALFQVEDKAGLVAEAKRILSPDGSVLVTDWSDSHGGMGPASDTVVTAEEARRYFVDAGFRIEKEIDAGEHHYGFVAGI